MLVRLILIRFLSLICVPFLNTRKVGNGPADGAGPDFRVPEDLISAYDAFVLSITDILVDTGREVWRRRF